MQYQRMQSCRRSTVTSALLYVDTRDGAEHAAIYYGDMNDQAPQSCEYTPSAHRQQRVRYCGPHAASPGDHPERDREIVLLRQEGRIGLFAKMLASTSKTVGSIRSMRTLNLPADGATTIAARIPTWALTASDS